MRKEVFAYFSLGICLFSWVSLPKETIDGVRQFTVASLGPAWKFSNQVKRYVEDRPHRFWKERHEDKTRFARVELENQILRSELEKMTRWIASEQRIQEQFDLLSRLEKQKETSLLQASREFAERRLVHLRSIIQSELIAMPSEIIYRDPSFWSSSLWINVGEDDNEAIGRVVVAKNSPVVHGTILVGLIDYVGKKQSRVRLVTDSGLSPSVRCVRGDIQDREIMALIRPLLKHIECEDRYSHLVKDLKSVQESLQTKEDRYLAKGELHGSSFPLWRCRSSSLQGIGFNLHYVDEEGAPPKDTCLLQEGDILVTTGLDGVFPPDLKVAVVTAYSKRSGGYAYDLHADSLISDINELQTLFVLPPRGE